ncbi:MAG: hypothetical protein RMJ66_02010 [Bacteroidia bacterium]|nr:hypothetical protein [Bacteroidia bacterium]MDW8133821.1 hypothetical protein [Bacteroidia bacterium]
MRVAIHTPVGPLYEGEAMWIAARSPEGHFEIWEGHAPLIAQLESFSSLHVVSSGGEKNFSLRGGFLWVTPTGEVQVIAY